MPTFRNTILLGLNCDVYAVAVVSKSFLYAAREKRTNFYQLILIVVSSNISTYSRKMNTSKCVEHINTIILSVNCVDYVDLNYIGYNNYVKHIYLIGAKRSQ